MTGRPVVFCEVAGITDEEEMGKQYIRKVPEVLSDVVRASSSYQAP
jgi:hypothetical protein